MTIAQRIELLRSKGLKISPKTTKPSIKQKSNESFEKLSNPERIGEGSNKSDIKVLPYKGNSASNSATKKENSVKRTASSLQRSVELNEDVKDAQIAANKEINEKIAEYTNELKTKKNDENIGELLSQIDKFVKENNNIKDVSINASLEKLMKVAKLAAARAKIKKDEKLKEVEVLKLFDFLENATPAEIEKVHKIIPQEVTFGNPQNVTFGAPIRESVRSSSPNSVDYMSLDSIRNAQVEHVIGREHSLAKKQIKQIIASVEKKPGIFKKIMNVLKFKPKHEKYALTKSKEDAINK